MDGDDIGMIEFGGSPGLTKKTRGHFSPKGVGFSLKPVQHLDGYKSIQCFIPPQIDHPHASASQFPDHAKFSDLRRMFRCLFVSG